MDLKDILTFLDGKKAYLLAIVSAINSFMVASNVYTADLGSLIQTIASILASGAKYQSDVLGIGK